MTDSGSRQRLAAILAADVVGYSRLMTADEHVTMAALDAARLIFRTQIESSQGRVIDMAGDSVLAVFDSATGAVSAAMAVQQALEAAARPVPEERRMRFRIGVHLGDALRSVAQAFAIRIIADAFKDQTDASGDAIEIRFAVCSNLVSSGLNIRDLCIHVSDPLRAIRAVFDCDKR